MRPYADKATPLPWEAVQSSIFGVNDERDENGNRAAVASCGDELKPNRGHKYGEERDANAAFIAHAANNFDALLRAAMDLKQMVEPTDERYATLARCADTIEAARGHHGG